MLTIGDFSKLSRIPITALRYYDEMALLKPVAVDQVSGYRYYSYSQLPRLNRILALKDLGFSLEQIARVVNEGLSLEQLRGMLLLKQAEQEQRVKQEQERLDRVVIRLKQIEQEGIMPTHDVIIKSIEPQLVASVRGTIPTYHHVGQLFNELYGYLGRYGASGLGVAIWHEEGFKLTDVDTEAVIFLKSRVPETERIKVYELPGVKTAASITYNGSYATLSQGYDALVKWIELNGYKVVGPNRELYLHFSTPVSQDDESYVTEIQFPVEKA